MRWAGGALALALVAAGGVAQLPSVVWAQAHHGAHRDAGMGVSEFLRSLGSLLSRASGSPVAPQVQADGSVTFSATVGGQSLTVTVSSASGSLAGYVGGTESGGQGSGAGGGASEGQTLSAPAVSADAAVSAAEQAATALSGAYPVRVVLAGREGEHGHASPFWQVTLLDATGQMAQVRVDAQSGSVLSLQMGMAERELARLGAPSVSLSQAEASAQVPQGSFLVQAVLHPAEAGGLTWELTFALPTGGYDHVSVSAGSAAGGSTSGGTGSGSQGSSGSGTSGTGSTTGSTSVDALAAAQDALTALAADDAADFGQGAYVVAVGLTHEDHGSQAYRVTVVGSSAQAQVWVDASTGNVVRLKVQGHVEGDYARLAAPSVSLAQAVQAAQVQGTLLSAHLTESDQGEVWQLVFLTASGRQEVSVPAQASSSGSGGTGSTGTSNSSSGSSSNTSGSSSSGSTSGSSGSTG
jgi:uncharacterized membrane protein YkoI